MKKIILHIGSGKAGSTSIQKSLIDGRSTNDENFIYPILRDNIGNQIIKYAFCKLEAVPKKITAEFHTKYKIDPANIQEYIKSTLAEQCKKVKTVVISSEFLFGSNKDEASKLVDYIKGIGFDEIHIIMYLRDPSQYYLSRAQQATKNRFNIPLPHNFNYKMKSAINTWSNVNATSLTVREFNTDIFPNGDVVKDFESYLFTVGINACLTSNRLNKSMSSELSQIFQDYHINNAKSLYDKDTKSKIIKKIKRASKINIANSSKPILKSDIEYHIHKRYIKELIEINLNFKIFGDLINKIKAYDDKRTIEDIEKIDLFKDLCSNFNNDAYIKIKQEIFDASEL
jgi:hypothetical protein